MADPVAWIMIERGWKVLASDGDELGRIHEVAGDENVDIFDGVVITTSVLGPKRYVPSEQVGEIYEGEVHVKLTNEQIEGLGAYEEPEVSEQIEPEKAQNKFILALKRAFFLDR
jgi:hypothetical protein